MMGRGSVGKGGLGTAEMHDIKHKKSPTVWFNDRRRSHYDRPILWDVLPSYDMDLSKERPDSPSG